MRLGWSSAAYVGWSTEHCPAGRRDSDRSGAPATSASTGRGIQAEGETGRPGPCPRARQQHACVGVAVETCRSSLAQHPSQAALRWQEPAELLPRRHEVGLRPPRWAAVGAQRGHGGRDEGEGRDQVVALGVLAPDLEPTTSCPHEEPGARRGLADHGGRDAEAAREDVGDLGHDGVGDRDVDVRREAGQAVDRRRHGDRQPAPLGGQQPVQGRGRSALQRQGRGGDLGLASVGGQGDLGGESTGPRVAGVQAAQVSGDGRQQGPEVHLLGTGPEAVLVLDPRPAYVAHVGQRDRESELLGEHHRKGEHTHPWRRRSRACVSPTPGKCAADVRRLRRPDLASGQQVPSPQTGIATEGTGRWGRRGTSRRRSSSRRRAA